MAKRIPIASVEEMEAYMGYSIKPNEWMNTDYQRYYSDLELVSADFHSRTLREYEEEKKYRALCIQRQEACDDFQSKVVQSDENEVTITRMARPGHYVFDVKVLYNFGLLLSFLFTEGEVHKIFHHLRFDAKEQAPCPLFILPKEVRDRIHEFATPTGTWENPFDGSFLRNAAEGLGTCCGFYFPFKDFPLLRTCRRMRTEALALAFQKAKFCLDDIDEVIQFLIAAGTIGRHNIRALEFSWISKSDRNRQWKNPPANDDFYPTLPSLHVEECTRLLQQCDGLRSLCLKFDDVSIAELSPEALKENQGLRQLCSMHNLQSLYVVNTKGNSMEQMWFVEWLQEQLLLVCETTLPSQSVV